MKIDADTLYLDKLSQCDGDPYEYYKQILLDQGLSEMDACHETALFMNMICDMMD